MENRVGKLAVTRDELGVLPLDEAHISPLGKDFWSFRDKDLSLLLCFFCWSCIGSMTGGLLPIR